ncbi:MAG: hypothetical protein DNFNHJIP_00327 [Candidatus Argoarchaeum ethanivorans]|uniref:Uncharacterized protein n=1 Tax=Candidatus Argoarchaeum ethanivorans TaxID=2608793 RepID=A0A811ZZW3_9EURY|nr:MAG: hypothetical protein DNFNHJIP_00327 [Candidatus Argoarchaeum ethanivorans]
MVIGGERVGDLHILHDDKIDAVVYSPLLINMRRIGFTARSNNSRLMDTTPIFPVIT